MFCKKTKQDTILRLQQLIQPSGWSCDSPKHTAHQRRQALYRNTDFAKYDLVHEALTKI